LNYNFYVRDKVFNVKNFKGNFDEKDTTAESGRVPLVILVRASIYFSDPLLFLHQSNTSFM